MNSELQQIKRLPQFLELYPHLIKPSAMRWLIYNRTTNGLAKSGAVFQRGRAWFVHEGRFAEYLSGQEDAA